MNFRTDIAIAVPGQGAQDAGLLRLIDQLAFCQLNRDVFCDVTGAKPEQLVTRVGVDAWTQNEVASVLTCYAACGLWEDIRDRVVVSVAAGYSVGQWTAMYMAGMLPFDQLLRVVWSRGKIMKRSRAWRDGAMAAIIGLPLAVVEALCEEACHDDDIVAVSNINAPAQTTIAGTRQATARAISFARERKAHKVLLLPVKGAWHCALLGDIVNDYSKFLDDIELAPPDFPVLDNVSGDVLPSSRTALKASLVQHMIRPVRWQDSVRKMVRYKPSRIVEVGYGSILTKFGFFIDRAAIHEEFATFVADLPVP